MNKKIQNQHIEYLSLLLVLSFLILNNIYIVLIGVSLSIYIINKKIVNRFINYIISLKKDRKINKHNKQNDRHAKPEYIGSEANEEDKIISLVEIIEESGFIPSIEKEKNGKAA